MLYLNTQKGNTSTHKREMLTNDIFKHTNVILKHTNEKYLHIIFKHTKGKYLHIQKAGIMLQGDKGEIVS